VTVSLEGEKMCEKTDPGCIVEGKQRTIKCTSGEASVKAAINKVYVGERRYALRAKAGLRREDRRIRRKTTTDTRSKSI